MKIHAGLKWDTIISRLNKQAGYEKYRRDQYGSIFKLDEEENCYFFISSWLPSDWSKQRFIDFLSLGLNTMTEDEAYR